MKMASRHLGLFLAGLVISGCAAPIEYETFTEPYRSIVLADGLYLREVQAGAYVVTYEADYAANSLLVEMPEEQLVWVDTPQSAEATRIVYEWIQDTFSGWPLIEINTGFHEDNLAGNRYLQAQSVPVYGSELTVELLARHSSPFAPPDHLFDIESGLTLTFGGEDVQVYYPGPTHTEDNVVVWFSDRRLLFGGCMVSGWGGVGNIADANLEAWPGSLDNLAQFPAQLVIPGHGDRFYPENVEETIKALNESS